MKPKKNENADLENFRGIFFQAGIVVALILCIVVINWKSYDDTVANLGELEVEIDDEIIPITQRQTTPPPPPPPPPPEIIEVVEDDVELKDELDMASTETNFDEEVEVIEMEEEVSDEVLPFAVVEDKPIFPGCEDVPKDKRTDCFQKQMQIFVGKNYNFPEMARQMGIEGKVYVSFVIEKNGEISNVVVERGVDKMLDDEAVRVIKSLPKMTPARQRGKPTRMSFTMPFNLKLQ